MWSYPVDREYQVHVFLGDFIIDIRNMIIVQQISCDQSFKIVHGSVDNHFVNVFSLLCLIALSKAVVFLIFADCINPNCCVFLTLYHGNIILACLVDISSLQF